MVNTMLSKIKNWVQKVPKKVKSFIVGMMAMGMIMPAVLPGVTVAAGPVFNNHPNDRPTLEVTNYTTSPEGYQSSTVVEPGQRVAFRVYIHNNEEGTTAENVVVSSIVTDGFKDAHNGSVTVSASNASSVTGNVSVTSSAPVKLEYVENSTKRWWFTDSTMQYMQYEVMPNTIWNGSIDLGDINGCFQYVQYVTFLADVVAQPANPAQLTLEKKVSTTKSNFVEQVDVERDDTVWFDLQVSNTGDEAAQNVVVRDVLPGGLTYVNGSTEVQRGQLVDDGVGDEIVTAGGLNIGELLGSNTIANVRFQAKVDSDSSEGVKTNTGYTKATSISEISDTAKVNVLVPQDNPGLTIAKTVTKGANGTNFAENVNVVNGDTVRFKLVLSNTGDVRLNNVNVRDNMPAGLNYDENSLVINGQESSKNITTENINIGNLETTGDNQSVDIFFNALVEEDSAKVLTNTGRTWADNHSEVSDSATVTVGEVSNDTTLSIAKTVTNGESSRNWSESVNAEDNDIVRFRLIVSNEGSQTAEDLEISDELPSGLNYVSNSTYVDGDRWDDDDGVITSSGISVGDLDEDDDVEVIFNVRVNQDNDRTLTNIGYAQAANADRVDDEARVVVDNGGGDDEPYLTVTKTVDDSTVMPGQEIRYTIRVENTGDAVATNVRITDSTPSRLTPDEDSLEITTDGEVEDDDLFGDGVIIDELQPGDDVVIRYDARVDSDVKSDMTLTNEVVARDDEGDRAEDEATVTVQGETAFLNITKSVNKTSVEAGEEVKYTITVENTGDADATHVRITDNLPMHLIDYIRGTLEIDGSNITEEDLFGDGIEASRLRVGDEIVIKYDAKVDEDIDADTTIENMAEVTADGGLKDRAFAHVNVAGGNILEPSVKLVKMVRNETTGESNFSTSNSANPGNVLVYKITLTNNGSETLTGVKVSDVLPGEITYLGGTVEIWMNSVQLTGEYNALTSGGISLPDMKPNDAVTITFRAKSKTTIANNTTLINTSTVTANQDINTNASARTLFTTVSVPVQELPKTGGTDAAAGAFMFIGLSSAVWFVREKMLLGSMM